MHPSTALATVLVDELVRGGVNEAVLCPGSRSAPLAYALEEADRSGRLRLHVRVDERSAGFLALGLAHGSGRPVPVVTTSGTAVANLHPAVLEAHHSGIPLVVLSADRPAELRGTGANQTTVQPGIFAGAVRWEADLPAPEAVTSAAGAHWRSTVCRALAAARGPAGAYAAGPVHLNVSFRDPLAPDLGDAGGALEDSHFAADGRGAEGALAGREGGAPWTVVATTALSPAPEITATTSASPTTSAPTEMALTTAPTGPTAAAGAAADPAPASGLASGERTLVLIGDLPDPELATAALEWARAAGWPVLAEPFGRLPCGPGVVPHGPLVAAAVLRGAAEHLVPERVVVVGRLTLFREVGALLRLPGTVVEQISAHERWTDPSHVVARVHGVGVLRTPPAPAPGSSAWVAAWVAAGQERSPDVARVAGSSDDDSAADELAGPADAGLTGLADAGLTGLADAGLTGLAVAAAVAASVGAGDQLVLGSSTVPRDLALVLDGTQAPTRVVASRGLAGIDGTVSTAIGAALTLGAGPTSAAVPTSAAPVSHVPTSAASTGPVPTRSVPSAPTLAPRTVALMGDLTFLHDAGGLVVGAAEPRPDLTIVVVNDDGGGIFSTLEYGEPARSATPADAAATERIFGTPHGTDLAALCAAHGIPHQRATSAEALRAAIAERADGITVIEVPIDRAGHRRVRDALA